MCMQLFNKMCCFCSLCFDNVFKNRNLEVDVRIHVWMTRNAIYDFFLFILGNLATEHRINCQKHVRFYTDIIYCCAVEIQDATLCHFEFELAQTHLNYQY